MKILWFTSTPSLASEFLNSYSQQGGWVSSLELQMAKVKEIELSIVFHFNVDKRKDFRLGNTSYTALPNIEEKNKIKKISKRWLHHIDPDYFSDWYIEIIKELKPDIIHIFGTEFPYGLILDKIQIPVIIQIQGNLTVCAKKWYVGLSSFDVFRYSRINPLIRAFGLWHEYFPFYNKALREQKILEKGKYFLGRTDWDRRVVKALSVDGTYFHCDELLRAVFHQHIWAMPSNEVFVFSSTISPNIYKGLETILETASLLKNKSNFNFEWQVIGIEGNEELVYIIEKKMKRKFTEQNIRFRGSMNAETLIDVLLKSDIYIHPSHIENSPNSVCEAMLLGMPIIATNVGGTPSIMKDNIDGLMVQDGDPYALTGAILELLENKELAIQLATNARKRAVIRHNPEVVCNDLMNIYKTIIPKIK
jgi:glycosyltransferase involved in cell wall biosynthesis